MKPSRSYLWPLLLFALIAFAANSVLARAALTTQSIDALSFTGLRLSSGALCLWMLMKFIIRADQTLSIQWRRMPFRPGSLALFTYALCFSLAYITIDAGIGALILFGVVQITVTVAGLIAGERLSVVKILGVLLALAGLSYLLLPDPNSSVRLSVHGVVLMIAAGVAWGAYSLLGRGSSQPLADSAANFVGTLPLCCLSILVALVFTHLQNMIMSALPSEDDFMFQISPLSAAYALASGILGSAAGYSAWYAVAPHLSRLQVGSLQLLVPVIAAIGGAVLLGEPLTKSFVIAAFLVGGGVMITLYR